MTSLRSPRRQQQRGFTLVEAIVAIVITSIIAGTMVLFINRPVRNFVDSSGRAEMSDVADLALRRMAREIRVALPNSARVTNSGGVLYLEFIPTLGGGRYLSADDNAQGGTPLSATDGNALSFSVVGPMPAISFPPNRQDYLAIYNLGAGFQDADAYAAGNLARITGQGMTAVGTLAVPSISFASVQAADLGGGTVVSATSNPFAAPANASPARPANLSPEQRFQVVGKPVIFRCAGNANGRGTLTRSVAATFSTTPSTPDDSAGVLLANNVVACAFSINGNANRQSSLVGLTLTLGRPTPDGTVETVTLAHQIHINNTP